MNSFFTKIFLLNQIVTNKYAQKKILRIRTLFYLFSSIISMSPLKPKALFFFFCEINHNLLHEKFFFSSAFFLLLKKYFCVGKKIKEKFLKQKEFMIFSFNISFSIFFNSFKNFSILDQ